MRIVSGSLKTIPTIWLPTMTAIASHYLRRQELSQNVHLQIKNLSDNIPIKKIVETATSTAKLKSQKSFCRLLKARKHMRSMENSPKRTSTQRRKPGH